MESTVSSSSPPSTATTAATAAIACLCTCFAAASVYVMQPVLAEVASRFHVSANDARLAFSVVSIAYALAFFILGPLSDRIDPRRMSTAGLVVAACAISAAGFVSDYRQLLVLLAVQGASAAMVPAAMFALMPRVAPKELIGTYFGFVIAASVVGITLGRSGMGMMTARFGLTGSLQVCGLVLLAVAALNQTMPLSQRVNTSSTTLGGAYANALRMLGSPQLLRLFGTGFLLFFGYLGILTFLTLRLHQAPFMFDSAAIGSISLLGLSALFGAPLSGRLTAKLGSLPVALSGLAIVMVAIACLAVAETTHMLALGLFLLFLGVFSCQPAVFVRIAERVSPTQRGAASSLYLLTCLGAGSISSVLLGRVWSQGGWLAVSVVSGSTVLLGAVLMLFDGRRGLTPPVR